LQNNIFSTLFVGQNLIKLTRVDSTNNFLKNLLSKSEPLPEGTVIMADDQFAGRGQQEGVWKAAPGKNLTFSLLLKPAFLSPAHQFLLNIMVSVAINQVLTRILGNDVKIKWPNDIYFQNKKLGGILIENNLTGNVIKTAVIGIGINVNQSSFEEDLADRACSVFQILQKNVNLTSLLAEICREIEGLYLALRAGKHNNMEQNYVNELYRLHTLAPYRKNNEVFEGMITGVTETGLLKMDINGQTHQFNFKEIVFLNHS